MNIVKTTTKKEGDSFIPVVADLLHGETAKIYQDGRPTLLVTRKTNEPVLHTGIDPDTFLTETTWCHKFEILAEYDDKIVPWDVKFINDTKMIEYLDSRFPQPPTQCSDVTPKPHFDGWMKVINNSQSPEIQVNSVSEEDGVMMVDITYTPVKAIDFMFVDISIITKDTNEVNFDRAKDVVNLNFD